MRKIAPYRTASGKTVEGVFWRYPKWPDETGKKLCIFYDRPKGKDGKRRQTSEIVPSNKIANAKALRAQRLKEVREGQHTEAAEQRLSFVVAEYLNGVHNTRTRDCYTKWLRHVTNYFGDLAIKDLTPRRIETFYGSLEFSQTYGDHIVKRLKAVVRYVVRHDILAMNPFDKVELAIAKRHDRHAEQRQKQYPLAPAEVGRIFAHLSQREADTDNLMWEALWRVALDGGFRMGEIRGLRWQNLQADGYEVKEQLLRDGSYAPPKSKSYGTVRLSKGTIDLLNRWRAAQKLAYGQPFDDLIFSDLGPLHFNKITYHWRQLLKAVGLRHRRFHDLRHTTASLIANAPGGSLLQIKEQLRHNDLSTTLDVYSHLFSENRTSGLDAFESIRKAG